MRCVRDGVRKEKVDVDLRERGWGRFMGGEMGEVLSFVGIWDKVEENVILVCIVVTVSGIFI